MQALRDSAVARRAGGTVLAVRRTLGVVTRTGWTCLGLLALCTLAGVRLGWQEAWSAAAVLGVVVLTSWTWLLGRHGHRVTHELLKPRVTVGDDAVIHLTVLNPGSRPLLPIRMEMPVGAANAVFAVPTLLAGRRHQRGFVLPTARRGVVTVGPVVSVRTDPVGLLRRQQNRTKAQQVHIHPRTVRLGAELRGLLRDVEGAVTQELSSSDVSFHALRDYVPGDDRRHVHWRSTARTGRLMIRQFEETRRSTLLVLLDTCSSHYETAEDFETAVSVACSLALNAIDAGREVLVVAGKDDLPTASVRQLLDASCLLETTEGGDCEERARRTCAAHPDVSVMVLVTGQHTKTEVLARLSNAAPVDTVVLALRCGSRAKGRHALRRVTVYDLDRLETLPLVMRRAQ